MVPAGEPIRALDLDLDLGSDVVLLGVMDLVHVCVCLFFLVF